MRVLILMICLVCAMLMGATTAAAANCANCPNAVVCVISDVPACPPPEVAMTITVNGEDVSDAAHESHATIRSRVRGVGKTAIKVATAPIRIVKSVASRVVTRVKGREHKIVVRIFHRERGCRH